MVSIDPFLYVAFALGWVVGRILPHRGPWVGRATVGCVALLLALLGISFRDLPLAALGTVVPYALALTALTLVLTAVVARALRRRSAPPSNRDDGARAERVPTSVVLLAALFVGVGIGRFVALPADRFVPWALYALLALVAFGLDLAWGPLRRAWVPVVAGVVGATAAAAVLLPFLPWAAAPVFASAYAFGWYSLAAPLVGAKAGVTLGLFAFLTNFAREASTIVLAPRLGRRVGGEGLASLGGATSMDTTLYFVVRYGDAEAGSLAIASGLALTAAASLLVPLLLAL